jgi:predicted lipoprotein
VTSHWLWRSVAVAASGMLVAIGVAAPAHALPVRKSHATLVVDAIDQFIVPHAETFKTATARLAGAMTAVCSAGGDAPSRAAAIAAFADTARAWGSFDFIRFGPVTRAHRLERILFWPDPRATAQRQLGALVAARKQDVIAPGALASQSVAVQGLTALEILLYDEKAPLGAGTDEAAVYRCAVARAIADNLATIAPQTASA